MTLSQAERNYPTKGSYTAVSMGLWSRCVELRHLYRAQTANISDRVGWLIEEAKRLEHQAEMLRGFPLCGGRVLEIGAGQCPIQLAYLGTKNEAIGIDLEVAPKHLSLKTSMQIVQKNGITRFAKTVVRKTLGVDRRLENELRRQLGCARMPQVTEMDSTQMDFASESFDLVFSRAVFEHISEPTRAAAEIRRVLKPGGVAIINLHLYTHDTGCHDTTILYGDRSRIPFLRAHLRPQFRHLVKPNVYVNGLRLAEWREIFASEFPGSTVRALCDSREEYRTALQNLRAQGQLEQYTDEELLSTTVNVSFLRQ